MARDTEASTPRTVVRGPLDSRGVDRQHGRLRDQGDDPVKKSAFKRFREGGGKAFWIWIAYQSIKGMITLSLIWIPLFLLWLRD